MTREDVKKQFADATEEQITAILSINDSDVVVAKTNNVEPGELKRLQGIETEYLKLRDAGLTDAEKAQKVLNDAETARLDYAKKSNRLDVEKILVAAGLTEEDYKDLIDGIVTDDTEKSKSMATNMASLVSKQKETATQKAKEDLMDGTTVPGGKPAGGGAKTEDVKFAEDVAASFATGNKESQNVFDNY